MTLLDVSIVNVAVPSIDRALHASSSDLQWILSGYALTFGLALVPAGRFGDARGRRNAFVFGIALFTITSALAGLATSPTWLVIARLLQGAAAGVVNPQVIGLIQQLFRGPERARPFGLLGATIGISTAVGPLLGGLLIAIGGEEHGWRWVFFVNVPVGVLAVILGWRLLPGRPTGQPGWRRLDPFGVLLLGIGVVLVLLPLVQEQQWRTPWKWALIPVGLAVLVAFGLWERRYARHHEPLFDLRLFSFQSYTLGSILALVYFGGFTAIFFIFTLFLQMGLGYSALVAGLAITPFALGSAAAAVLGGRIVNRFGRPLVAIGLLTVVVGLAATVIGAAPRAGRPSALGHRRPAPRRRHRQRPGDRPQPDDHPLRGAGRAGRQRRGHAPDRPADRRRGWHRRRRVAVLLRRWPTAAATGPPPSNSP